MRHETVPVQFESYDDRLPGHIGDRRMVRLFDECRWAEGPVYFPASRMLLFSDIPNDRVLRHDEVTGTTTTFREPAGFHNGHFADRQGRLLSCEHGERRVTRTEADGSLTVIADRFDGKRLNSPNDLVEHSDGSIWFTDPTYGIHTNYEGWAATSELGERHLFRVVPGEQPVPVASDFDQPNGLAFSLDERQLYVADSNRGHLRVFDVEGDRLGDSRVLAQCSAGAYDGLQIDGAGRIWVSSAEGVEILHPDGTLLGKLFVPEVVANLTFGGLRRNDLYLTATTSLYLLRTTIIGAPFPR